ncbi:FMN-binding protein [Parasphaerochaeta coccoides]|uniref:FMN-binding domain protein n=1 Tax=Parasphaerochaeta coccoides (strain ATCC BAA-1237 / DSM 17374 / SPN1) TaxID=760011 RepID=F4GJC1_PARC1|nr:FMN-binding protein [Parasphaerochaeta coccoides]AEC01761.1 FMN-binding domain protein [Parasphaerochaeta coccoides DSM 17374]
MTEKIKTVLIVTISFVVACFLLAGLNAITAPIVSAAASSQEQADYIGVASGNSLGLKEAVEGVASVNYRLEMKDVNGKHVGWVLDLTGSGFGGPMRIVASYDLSGAIIAGTILENTETPGIGTRSQEPGYFDMFTGTGGQVPVPVSAARLSAGHVQTMSGATITFTGIARALAAGSDYIKSLGGTR